MFPIIFYGQVDSTNINENFIKKNQATLDIEFLGIDMTGTIAFNNKMGIGIGAQFGPCLRIFLNNPEYLYCGGGCDEGDCCARQRLKAAYIFYAELIKFRVFWRYYLSKVTYFNTGIFGSKGKLLGGEISNENLFAGLQIDFYTGSQKFKAGLKFQAGKSFMSYSSEKKSEFFLFSITPAFQFHF